MIIRVTQDDILQGRRYSPAYCPVARAVRRATDVCPVAITIGLGSRIGLARVGDDIYELPSWVADIICGYDIGKPIKPFTFSLPIKKKAP